MIGLVQLTYFWCNYAWIWCKYLSFGAINENLVQFLSILVQLSIFRGDKP